MQNCGQDSLAYLTAKTHGLDEEAEAVKANMPEEADLPEVLPGAALLKPPPPIMQTEANWPLLTVSKGFFEGIKAVRGGTGPGQPVVQAAPSALDIGDDAMGEAGAGWDDDEDDVGLGDDDEFADAVKGKNYFLARKFEIRIWNFLRKIHFEIFLPRKLKFFRFSNFTNLETFLMKKSSN